MEESMSLQALAVVGLVISFGNGVVGFARDVLKVRMNGGKNSKGENTQDHDLLIEINVRTERLEQDVAEIKQAVAQRDD